MLCYSGFHDGFTSDQGPLHFLQQETQDTTSLHQDPLKTSIFLLALQEVTSPCRDLTQIQYTDPSPSQSSKTGKKKKRYKQEKNSENSCLLLIQFYMQDHKDSPRLLSEPNIFNKVSGNKTNIQKSMFTLYSNNKHAEKGIRETILFHNSIKKKKAQNNPNQGQEDRKAFYNENCKSLKKKKLRKPLQDRKICFAHKLIELIL